ncbi:MAG: hypothetical protein IT286_05420 [Proteobacteria bacterium]|nr:hypothetical protein [Pseudomonadota bacterium]
MKKFIVLAIALAFSPAHANEPSEAVKVLVKDIGIMGLASHDLFAWDHRKQTNKENGRLDLSTLFGNTLDGVYADGSDWYKAQYWKHGGNKKNRENAPVYTVTQQLMKEFELQIQQGKDPTTARLHVLKKFHGMVRDSFVRLAGLPFPQAGNTAAAVNNQEQAAMRILHDILPGQILMQNGQWFDVTQFKTAQTFLCDEDMNCAIKTFDGDYDAEYKAIRIPLVKWLGIHFKLNLQNIDRKFIINAGLDPDLAAQQLLEIGEGKRSMSDTFFAPYLIELFAKAQSSLNTDETVNTWVEQVVATNASMN